MSASAEVLKETIFVHRSSIEDDEDNASTASAVSIDFTPSLEASELISDSQNFQVAKQDISSIAIVKLHDTDFKGSELRLAEVWTRDYKFLKGLRDTFSSKSP